MCTIRDKLEKCKNIYDVLVILYEEINDEEEPSYIQKYDDVCATHNWEKINRLLDELLNDTVEFGAFIIELSVILEQECKLNVVHILEYFDQVFIDREQYPHLGFGNKLNIDPVESVGPLNHMRDIYGLYFTQDSGIVQRCDGDRLINWEDDADIFSRISSYRIINVSRQQVKIKRYKFNRWNENANSEEIIRIACAPLCNKEWFGVDYQEHVSGKTGYFSIVNTAPCGKNINEIYMQLLGRLIDEQVDIVIFPELAMNEQTEEIISDYLSKQSLGVPGYSLKLVFLGSLWSEGKNECVILSGQGSVLVRNQKTNPFILKRDEKKYKERLKSRAKELELLDVESLGRILYVVCKDGLADMRQISFWNEYRVNFEVISAYSSSISFFEEQMRALAGKYYGIGIVANSCAPRPEEEPEIGFVEVPCRDARNRSQNTGIPHNYTKDAGCQSQCAFGGCIHIFELKPNKVKEEHGKLSMEVDYIRNFATRLNLT